MPESRFEVFKDKKGEWRFRLRARNNEIIAVGEGYTSKQNCLKGIKSIKKNAGGAKIIDKNTGATIEEIEEVEPLKEGESVLTRDVTGLVEESETEGIIAGPKKRDYVLFFSIILAIIAISVSVFAMATA